MTEIGLDSLSQWVRDHARELPENHYELEGKIARTDAKAWAAMVFMRRWWGEPIARAVWDALTPKQRRRIRPLLPKSLGTVRD